MNKVLLGVILLSILSGCAGSSDSKRVKIADIDFDNVTTPEGEKLYCKKEMITGTHRKTITCLTKAEMDEGRRGSDAYITKMRASPEVGSGGG
jgi:hypothetical protein